MYVIHQFRLDQDQARLGQEILGYEFHLTCYEIPPLSPTDPILQIEQDMRKCFDRENVLYPGMMRSPVLLIFCPTFQIAYKFDRCKSKVSVSNMKSLPCVLLLATFVVAGPKIYSKTKNEYLNNKAFIHNPGRKNCPKV